MFQSPDELLEWKAANWKWKSSWVQSTNTIAFKTNPLSPATSLQRIMDNSSNINLSTYGYVYISQWRIYTALFTFVYHPKRSILKLKLQTASECKTWWPAEKVWFNTRIQSRVIMTFIVYRRFVDEKLSRFFHRITFQ